jgi:P4 family phage/plasmid primase-like protien
MYTPNNVNFGSGNAREIAAEISRRITIAQLWRKFGFPDAPTKETGLFRSPFREDRTASFSIYERDGKLRFKDHGDPDCHGDVIDFYRLATGCDEATAFKEMKAMAGIGNDTASGYQRAAQPKRQEGNKQTDKPFELSEEESRQQEDARNRLLEDVSALAEWRGWKPETIEKLAREGTLGLWTRGEPAFMSLTGLKARTLETGKDKKVWYPFGKSSLWRSELIKNTTERIIVAEGEIDAITLIDCGMESDGKTIVVALPGADYNIERHLDLLRGRKVVFVGDMDDAGMKSVRKSTKRLRSVASAIYWMNVSLDDAAKEIKDFTELRDARGGLAVEEIEKRFFRVDNFWERIKAYVKRKYNRDIDAATPHDGSWPQIEDESAAELYAQIGQVRCIGDEWFIETNGVWMPTDRDMYRPLALEVLPMTHRTQARSAEVIKRLEAEQQVTRSQFCGAAKFDTDGSVLLAVRNGVLRLGKGEGAKIELLPPNPTHGFAASLLVAWHPDALMPTFVNLLEQSLPDAQDRELLLDVLATSLIPDSRWEVALVLQGEAGTGKSTVMAPIASIFGSTCSSLSLSDLCHVSGYKLSMLHNKLINLATELNTLEMDDTGLFKQLVSGELFTARPIYGKPFEMRSTATLVFLANSLPRFKHGTDAEARRLRFVKFSRKVQNPDVMLKNRVAAEAEGVFAELVRRASDLLNGAKLAVQGQYGQEVARRFQVSNDPIGQFVSQRCMLGGDLYCTKSDLYAAFTDFREQHGLSDKLDDGVFFKNLYDRFQGVKDKQKRIDGKVHRVITGIDITDVESREGD